MNSKHPDQTLLKVTPQGDLSDERNVRRAIAPHQRDFPYERGEEAQVTRREFCNFLALTSTTLFVSAAGLAGKAALEARTEAAQAPKRIEGAQSLAPGSSLNFRYPSDDDTAILVRSSDGEYHAYGQKCTHLACPVYFEPCISVSNVHVTKAASICGPGMYSTGPPPRPLDQIILEVREGGEVWAVGRKAGGHEHSV